MRSSILSRQSLISLSMQYGRQHLAIQCIIVKQKGVWPNAPRMEALQKISPHIAGSTSTAPIQSPSFSCKGSIIVIYSASLILFAKKIPAGNNWEKFFTFVQAHETLTNKMDDTCMVNLLTLFEKWKKRYSEIMGVFHWIQHLKIEWCLWTKSPKQQNNVENRSRRTE